MFAAEAEAHDFYKKVANRSKYASMSSADIVYVDTLIVADGRLFDVVAKVKEDKKDTPTKTKKSKKTAGKIDKSLISGPVRSSSPFV